MKKKIMGADNKVVQPALEQITKMFMVEEVHETHVPDHIYQNRRCTYFQNRDEASDYQDKRVREILDVIDYKEGVKIEYDNKEDQAIITYNGGLEIVILEIYKQSVTNRDTNQGYSKEETTVDPLRDIFPF